MFLAKNASVNLNGLPFNIERRDNVITDVVPGTTLTLNSVGAMETLVQADDTAETSKNLQKFVDAFNDVMKLLKRDLASSPTADRNTSLAGDSALSNLRVNLSKVLSEDVGISADVRSLVDLGIKSDRDGILSIDTAILKSALSRDPDAVNQIFSTATAGISDQIETLVDAQTNITDGLLTSKTNGLNLRIRNMDTAASKMEASIEAYKLSIARQFAAMEKIMAGLKSSGTYLAGQSGSG
jgi:flagellar hook-associated protein 2